MILEICANSYQSAINAQRAGAHRIELCAELSVGGVTPSYGLVKQVCSALQIPVFVLIRPRSGDFIYSASEFNTMKADIELCKDLGAKGIVSGVLTHDGRIDVDRTRDLIELSRPLEFTFHRAFDELMDPMTGLHHLMALGVDRILTSGQQTTAVVGLELIQALLQKTTTKPIIMPGGGISSENASRFKSIGISELHASCSTELEQHSKLFTHPQTVSDPIKIKALLDAL
jgi:copper homeostasis protein